MKPQLNPTRVVVPLLAMVFVFACLQCKSGKEPLSDSELATQWADMATYIAQYTPANSPTFASRAFGYIALAQYETIVHGYPTHLSLNGQLNGLVGVPEPEPDQMYDWHMAYNAGQAYIIKAIYQQTSDENKAKIEALALSLRNRLVKERKINPEVEARSVSFGTAVAHEIFEWSKTDGGHRGYLHNFDKTLEHPSRPGAWKPPLFAQSFSHHPLHPHWGENRTFLKQNQELPLPEMIAYDTVPGSPYYEEFMAVYKKDLALTQPEKEAAIWWGDDPDVSFTPPGHSYFIATIAIKQKQPSLIKCAEVYAKTALAVADSFRNCWKWKYHFFSERPNTFIPKFIDPEWESFWPDPPFPAFPSGHAINAGAMATILENEFGKTFHFIDNAHEGRPRDELRDTDFVNREFSSFQEAALETADSRFYGGIHTPQDNIVGLEEGAVIAQNVLDLKWYKKP